MPDYLRKDAFVNIADVPFEDDNEIGFNLLFFYDALDKDKFSGHEHEWVTVYKQKVKVRVIRPGENLIFQLECDFYDIKLGKRGWSSIKSRAEDYGAPAVLICASKMFEVSIGNHNNWIKWVQAKILLWEEDPGYQVQCALIGTDVTDQLASQVNQ
ncbi:9057_t:CDS:2 [Diversispora eburnea]|uniref:9057_t:CDS:1 n=1 Tax=Diversispora eburnea TaxID=1213867 RepID=A0A9N9BS83_9GLOM|nr:9057_t:CDS:2 [Diversispora eburnea]